jgi:predicted nucleic acid-binding protein
MIIVADTSPISYLILINEINVLPVLYGRVVIPPAVFDELTIESAPEKVRDWFDTQPAWIETIPLLGKVEDQLAELLDGGESEAIQLAKDIKADIILIDDLAGRIEAERRGLKIIGLIGVLAAAKKLNLIDVESVILKLRATNFFVSEDLIAFLKNH